MELELECTQYPNTSGLAGGVSSDTQRFSLAYQELAVASGIAGADAKLPEASDACLDVLTAIASGQAQNASGE